MSTVKTLQPYIIHMHSSPHLSPSLNDDDNDYYLYNKNQQVLKEEDKLLPRSLCIMLTLSLIHI